MTYLDFCIDNSFSFHLSFHNSNLAILLSNPKYIIC